MNRDEMEEKADRISLIIGGMDNLAFEIGSFLERVDRTCLMSLDCVKSDDARMLLHMLSNGEDELNGMIDVLSKEAQSLYEAIESEEEAPLDE